MEKSVGDEGLEFQWGKKRKIGGKNNNIQFYDSFTYDGDEYCLYDCVLVGDRNEPDSGEPFIGKIIKIWEHTSKRAKFARNVKLLWFLKQSEISPFLEGVPDVLANELFLASGEGPGLANVNQVEAIGGKCSVLCISKDKRNPQPSQEDIESADFVFRRAFDVGSCKVLDTIGDKIAGVDVQFIFNRGGCEKEAVQKVKAEINGNVDSLKSNGPSASGLVREIEDNSIESSDFREYSYGCKERKGKGQHQLAIKEPMLTEERSNKESGVQEGRAHYDHDPCEAYGSRGNHCDGKAQETEVKKEFTKQYSLPVEETDGVSCEASGSRVNHSSVKKPQANNVKNQLTKQTSMPAEERDSISCEASRVYHSDAKKAQANDREIKDSSIESSVCRESSYSCKERKGKGQNQLATKKTMLTEERFNKDSGVQEGRAHKEYDRCETSGSWGDHCDGKAQETEVRKQFTKQESMPTKERDGISCETSGSRVNHSDVKKAQANGTKKQLTKQKSMPAEARYANDLNGLDKRTQKKEKLDGSVTVPDGQNTNMLQSIRSNVKKETGSLKRPRDKVTEDDSPHENPSFVKKKRDLGVTVSEGKDAKNAKNATEKGLSKKPTFDGKLSKRSEEKMLADDKQRSYQVIEVSQKPDAVKPTWYGTLPWEDSMRDAEEKGKLVLLQNLDPTYTSSEVQDIVFSALNEQCTARMIERTSATIPHIGQALVIFDTREAAERVIGKLDEGCLLLSNGRPLVASFTKINPPGKPSSFPGHIKLNKLQARREMRGAVATSHCSQENNIEKDMALEWCLHQARSQHTFGIIFKRQAEEAKSLRINFKPKLR